MNAMKGTAQKLLWILFGASLVMTGATFYMAFRAQAWQVYVGALAVLGYTLTVLAAIWLVGHNGYNLGVHLTLAGFYVLFPVSVAVTADMGLIYGVCEVIVIVVLASQLLRPDKVRIHVVVSLVMGALTALLDFALSNAQGWLPYSRYTVPEFRTIIPIMTMLLGMAFGVYILRRVLLTAPLPTSQSLLVTSRSPLARNTRLTAVVMTVLMGISAVFNLYTTFTDGAWQSAVIAGILFVTAAIYALSLQLCRRDQFRVAAWVNILTIVAAVPIISLFVSNVGMPLAFALIIVVLAIQTLPKEESPWGILIGVAGSVIGGIVDLTATDIQVSIPAQEAFVPILATTGVILFGALIVFEFRSLALTNKLIVVFLAITLVIAGGITLYSQVRSSQILQENIGVGLSNLAEARALAVGDILNRQIDMLNTLALNEALQKVISAANAAYGTMDENAIRAEIERLDQEWAQADAAGDDNAPLVKARLNTESSVDLREFRQKFGDNIEVFATDRYGAIVATSNRTSDYNQADEAWWQATYNNGRGRAFIGIPEFDASTNGFGVRLAVPVYDSSTRELIGILRTTYSMTRMSELLAERFGNTGRVELYFFQVLEPARVLAEGETQLVDAELVSTLQVNRGTIYSEFVYQGKPSLVSQAVVNSSTQNADIRSMGWWVVVHQDQDDALASVNEQTRQALLLVMFIIGGVMAVVVFLAQFITAPIIRLTDVTAQFGAGDLTARAKVDSVDEIGDLGRAFNQMANQLNETLISLEQRIEERTRALQTSTEVSRRLSTILDEGTLLEEVVTQLQSAFGYYHAHIYLVEERKGERGEEGKGRGGPSSSRLLLAAATGEAGKIMLARGHFVAVGQGLVGRAAASNQPVLVTDTRSDPNWLANPLLPETQSEVAAPIAVGETVLGVLDVQQNRVSGLSDTDVDLLRTLANQTALALQNARSYEQSRSQAEFETLLNAIGQKIQRANSVEDVLQTGVRELGLALAGSRISVSIQSSAVGREQGGKGA